MEAEIKDKLLKIVKANYEAQAADFSASRQKLFWPEIAKLAAPVRAGDRVLDLGCGQGRLLEVFKGRVIDYLGIDQSEALIKIARANYPGRNFQVGNILDLARRPAGNFDYIFCIAVLHHVPGEDDRTRFLKSTAEKLNPGGRVVISVWNLWARPKFWRLILKFRWQKMIGKNEMDRGDILFPWGKPAAARETASASPAETGSRQRYYHAFTSRELKKISRAADLKIEKLYNDKFNYYLILSRN